MSKILSKIKEFYVPLGFECIESEDDRRSRPGIKHSKVTELFILNPTESVSRLSVLYQEITYPATESREEKIIYTINIISHFKKASKYDMDNIGAQIVITNEDSDPFKEIERELNTVDHCGTSNEMIKNLYKSMIREIKIKRLGI